MKVYDLGLSRDQLVRMRCLRNVEVVQPDADDWPAFARYAVLNQHRWATCWAEHFSSRREHSRSDFV